MEYEKSCNNCYYGTDYYKSRKIDRCSVCNDTPNLVQWRPISKLKVKKKSVKVYHTVIAEPKKTGILPCKGCIYDFNLKCIEFREHMIDKGFDDCEEGLKHFYIIKSYNKRKPKDFKE